MRGRRLQTPTLCITGLFNPRSKSYNFLVRRTSGIPNQGGAKMLRTKHLKMAVVPMTLLALLSTAVPVASAQETTDESFYELTTTPSGGDMIVGEPGTTILFDSSNGELVDVLPPSEAEDYSVTVSRGCADSKMVAKPEKVWLKARRTTGTACSVPCWNTSLPVKANSWFMWTNGIRPANYATTAVARILWSRI